MAVPITLEPRTAATPRVSSLPAILLPYLPLVLTLIALACGIALRGMAFAADRSLWIDEAMLALNILKRSPSELFQPLDHNQGAPLGFLLACKASTGCFGNGEYALRLPALLASILALLAFALASKQLLPRPAAQLALWLFAISPYLIAYSAECKQYSTDAAASAVLLALAAGLLNGRAGFWRWVLLALGGAVAVWFSHPSLFVMLGLGSALLARAVLGKDRKAVYAVLITGSVWISSFATVYAVNLRHIGENRYLQDYWAGYFLPFPSKATDLFWIVEKLGQFLAYPGGFAMAVAIPIFVGIATLAKQRNGKVILTALLGPFAFALVASSLQKYPFCGRLLIFLVPMMILLVASGAAELAAMIGRNSPAIAALGLAFLILTPAIESRKQLCDPKHAEELKPVLRELQSQWQPGDRLYVYNGSGDAGAGPAFEFYASQFALPRDRIVLGGIHRAEPDEYLNEVRAMAPGGRVWFLASHEHRDEVIWLRAYFESIRKLGPAIVRPGAGAFAYDER